MRNYLIAIAALVLINSSVISLYHVVSASMDDTLMVGDAFVVLPFWYGIRLPFMETPVVPVFDPKPDDILVFRAPLDDHEIDVKRCIAAGGQVVEIVEKRVYVDGGFVPLPPMGKFEDPAVIPQGPAGAGRRDYRPPETVPDDAIYVLGDNRDNSFDSRFWGVVPKGSLRGRVWFVIVSIDPAVPWTDPRHKIRWDRFLHRPR